MPKDSVGIISLGCPRNLVDSQEILRSFTDKGHTLKDLKDAQIAVVNTCAFIEDAKKESIEVILELLSLKKQGKLKKVIVAGCLTQRYRQELACQLPEVDEFIGTADFGKAHKAVAPSQETSLTPAHYAYLKICEGCVHACSYCVIPKIKGKFVSQRMDTLVAQARQLNRQRVSELNIIGQDITGYGLDRYKKRILPQLLKKLIAAAPSIGWFRLLYLYPHAIVDELLDCMRQEPRICRYIDMPIQHINARILKLMNRRGTPSAIFKLIEKIRKKLPGVALRTSVIVGFPTETEREFKELLRCIEDVQFERLGAFIYSREEGTPAYAFKHHLPRKVKIARFDAVMQLQQEVSTRVNARLRGKTLEVLIDQKDKDAYLGRTQYDAPEVDGLVYVRTPGALAPGDFVQVKITDTREYDLVGDAL